MTGVQFRRVVVGLSHGSASQAAVGAAANFAELLNIELLAAFISDATLPALAELAGARELRPFGQGWQAIERTQIIRETDRAIGVARHQFTMSVGGRAITTNFDVVASAEAIASLINAEDVVAIIEPANPAEQITWQFTALLDAAFARAGAVLAVPRKLVRTAGPIVTMASNGDDPVLRAALQIAAASAERLIVLTTPGTRLSPRLLREAEQLGVKIEPVVLDVTAAEAQHLVDSLRFGERLRVLPRSALTDNVAGLLSLLRGIPWLVIERGREESGTSERERTKPTGSAPAD